MFVLRNWPRMLAHTFAGTTIKSMLGLEGESAVFARFRAKRRAERDYIRLSPDETRSAPPQDRHGQMVMADG